MNIATGGQGKDGGMSSRDVQTLGIARVVRISEPWLPAYVNTKYADVPRMVRVTPKKGV